MTRLYVTLSTTLSNFRKNESGATAIEYGLIAAGVALAIVTIIGTMGDSIAATFTTIGAALE